MMLFEIILKFFLLKLCIVQTLSQGIMEDIFYGESNLNTNLELQKLKQQIEINKNEDIPISDLQQYLLKNRSNIITFNNVVKTHGKCTNLLSIRDSFYIRKKYLRRNLNILSSYLNDKNYLFNDYDGNIIVYSTCTNFIDLSCVPKIFFVSKL